MTARRKGRSRNTTRRPTPTTRDGSDLCLQCGMCCDGSLFAHASLGEHEVELAHSFEMVPDRVQGVLKFKLPCPQFRDGACSVYDQTKPAICGDYRCRLLAGYTANQLDLGHCLDVIAWMQGLARELEEELAIPVGTFTFEQLFTFTMNVRPHEQPDVFARFLLTANRYLELNHQHFGFEYARVDDLVAAAEAAARGAPVTPTSEPASP